MAGFIGGRTSAFDYIGPELPNNPQNGEMWFDTDGASDGTGEVKVYDGSNDSWEATGFTSHADLTDVTRSAHHPPVEVSGPLTQPSDQSLGLSIGDGLDDSNGTLVAALGNGLGVDGSGQVYIPASAVSQSMLGFDTATQSELDEHAGDTTNPHSVDHAQLSGVGTSDHHSRYSDAEAREATDGIIDAETVDGQHASELGQTNSTVQKVVEANPPDGGSDTATYQPTGTVAVAGPVRTEMSGGISSASLTFNFADGGSHTIGLGNTTDSENNTTRWAVPAIHGKRITKVVVDATDDDYFNVGNHVRAHITGVESV